MVCLIVECLQSSSACLRFMHACSYGIILCIGRLLGISYKYASIPRCHSTLECCDDVERLRRICDVR